MRALEDQLEAAIPPTMKLTEVMDATQTIRASVRDVERTLLISIVLVIVVVFVFLRNWRSTLIPSVAVPISLLGTFGVMYLLGYSIDNLSLMALTVATGFVVDDAIVVVENISRHLEDGMMPLEAALRGRRGDRLHRAVHQHLAVRRVHPHPAHGRHRRPAVPGIRGDPVGGHPHVHGGLPHRHAHDVRQAAAAPSKSGTAGSSRPASGGSSGSWGSTKPRLAWVLRHQFVTLMVAVGTVASTVVLFIIVPKGFFPQQDTGRMMGAILADQDTSFQAMRGQAPGARPASSRQDPAVDHVMAFVGGGGVTNTGRMFLALKPNDQRKVTADQIIARLRGQAGPGARRQPLPAAGPGPAHRRPPGQRPVPVHPPGRRLQGAVPLGARRCWTSCAPCKQLTDVNSDQQNLGLQATLVVDRATASRLGITAQMIDDTLYDAFGQRQVSTMYTPLNQYHVVMEVAPEFWQNPDSLKTIYVRPPSGAGGAAFRLRPLPAGEHHPGGEPPGPAALRHPHLQPAAWAWPWATRSPPSTRPRSRSACPPPSAAASWARPRPSRPPWPTSRSCILAAFLAVYLVLGILYESLIHPITIISTLPSAGVGALLALLVFHTDLSVIALIGIILLIGIVKKNAILMIDFALEAERREGTTPEQSIFQACLLRFRPITMTTMAALLGGLPLALGLGTGSELRRPLGIAIVGGLVFSQMLTLFTTPVIYLYFDRLSLWWGRRRGRTHPGGPLAEAATLEN